jgi:methylenetetrahydrofolate--tRNA-(uracil-5-)-methyltransferase
MAARFAIADAMGQSPVPPPATTALGALLNHITGGADAKHFQPMNVNFGLFPPLVPPPLTKDQRKPALVARARSDLASWMGQ